MTLQSKHRKAFRGTGSQSVVPRSCRNRMPTPFQVEPQSQIVQSHRVAEWSGHARENLLEKRSTVALSEVVETLFRSCTSNVAAACEPCADAPSRPSKFRAALLRTGSEKRFEGRLKCLLDSACARPGQRRDSLLGIRLAEFLLASSRSAMPSIRVICSNCPAEANLTVRRA